MRNRHIAFIIYPQYPFVGPALPIAAVLVRRGNRVTFVTSERFSLRVAVIGAEVVPLSIPIYTAGEAGKTDDIELILTRLIGSTLEQIEDFYQANPPTLIVYDINSFAGRILSTRMNIPAIQMSPTFAHEKNSFTERVPNAAFREEMLSESRSIDTVLGRFGVTNSHDYMFYREKLNIYLFPKALQPFADTVGDSCFFAGRCAGEQLHYGRWSEENAGEMPIVLVATSTHYVRGTDYFKLCIEALKGLQWHVVLSIGDSGDPASLEPLPPHFEIVQHTSHVKILPHTSLLICLGGIITSSEAAYHGVPLLITSHGYQELEWQADNLVKLGIADHIMNRNLDVNSLREAAVRMLGNEEVHRRVRQMRGVVRQEPGAEETANLIEKYLEVQVM